MGVSVLRTPNTDPNKIRVHISIYILCVTGTAKQSPLLLEAPNTIRMLFRVSGFGVLGFGPSHSPDTGRRYFSECNEGLYSSTILRQMFTLNFHWHPYFQHLGFGV